MRYGWAMSIGRIDQLDEDGFAETEAARIEPRLPRQIAGHTLAYDAGLTVIDARIERPRWARP